MSFVFKKLHIPGPILVESKAFFDERGFFTELFKGSDFVQNGIPMSFVQDNFSRSKRGVIRGLHYQLPPKAQGKLVRVLKGRGLDIAVDIRRASETFLKYVAIELSEDNNLALFIPEGFAHDFMAFTDDTFLLYKCTNEYSPEHERGIRYDDPDINIDWGIVEPLVAKRDADFPYAKNAEVF